MTEILGIDIGGTGIKGALVDLDRGELTSERIRILTPKNSTPKNCADVVAKMVHKFRKSLDPEAPIGIAIPGPIVHGTVMFMANLHKSWVGTNADDLFSKKLKRPVYLCNDADAAGFAEARYGAAKGVNDLVIVTTLGTGIGSAIIYKGHLIPNTELGHLEIDGHDAETRASSGYKTKKKLSYKEWSKCLQRYYDELEKLFSPDLIVVGGGISKQANKFLPLLKLRPRIVAAKLENQAGIVGAAALAAERMPGYSLPSMTNNEWYNSAD